MESPDEEAQRMSQQLDLQRKVDAEAMRLSSDEAVPSKPSKNGPCPCGSGKKYKQCCGKSGPKKGVFAGNGASAS